MIGRLRIAIDEFGNRIECVEEKVWMQLHPESLELGLGEPEFSFLVFPKVVDGLTNSDDAPVNEDVRRAQSNEQRCERHWRLVRTRPGEQQDSNDLQQPDMRQRHGSTE